MDSYSLKVFRDWYSVVKTAQDKGIKIGQIKGRAKGRAEGMAEGIAKGIAKGIEEGEKKKQIEIARNLKALGVATDVIAKSTRLTPEEIEKL